MARVPSFLLNAERSLNTSQALATRQGLIIRGIEMAFLDQIELVGVVEAQKLLGLSSATLRRFRQTGVFQENLHWVKLGRDSIQYNRFLLIHWAVTRDNPKEHERILDEYRREMRKRYRLNIAKTA